MLMPIISASKWIFVFVLASQIIKEPMGVASRLAAVSQQEYHQAHGNKRQEYHLDYSNKGKNVTTDTVKGVNVTIREVTDGYLLAHRYAFSVYYLPRRNR